MIASLMAQNKQQTSEDRPTTHRPGRFSRAIPGKPEVWNEIKKKNLLQELTKNQEYRNQKF